jgi:lipopolysaccharide export system permease protein
MEPNILDNFNDRDKEVVMNYAMTLIKANLENIENYKSAIVVKQKIINGYETEYHKRIAFSLACLVLFFIGTPLGSIIRKGGFGLPMIMAIVIFVIYFFISILGKNMAESNTISPFLGGWLATFVLLPFGILLMIRATRDKGIFNVDAFLQPITNFFTKIFKFKKSH